LPQINFVDPVALEIGRYLLDTDDGCAKRDTPLLVGIIITIITYLAFLLAFAITEEI
jgi:hypothetical protein|tara:strand:- start:23 stop:193 length:171 start_codon:yes stop_codon:yes gene_type:complete